MGSSSFVIVDVLARPSRLATLLRTIKATDGPGCSAQCSGDMPHRASRLLQQQAGNAAAASATAVSQKLRMQPVTQLPLQQHQRRQPVMQPPLQQQQQGQTQELPPQLASPPNIFDLRQPSCPSSQQQLPQPPPQLPPHQQQQQQRFPHPRSARDPRRNHLTDAGTVSTIPSRLLTPAVPPPGERPGGSFLQAGSPWAAAEASPSSVAVTVAVERLARMDGEQLKQFLLDKGGPAREAAKQILHRICSRCAVWVGVQCGVMYIRRSSEHQRGGRDIAHGGGNTSACLGRARRPVIPV